MIAAIATLSLSLHSCVQDVTTPDLPFVEQMVVSGFVYADSSEVCVSVSRSLPLNATYSFEAASVANAAVTVTGPQGSVTLQYDSARYCYRAPLQATVGSHYSLHVVWNGHDANATTVVPDKPVISDLLAVRTTTSDRGTRTRIQYTVAFQPNANSAFCVSNSAYVINLADSSASDTLASYRGLPNFRNVISGKPADTTLTIVGNAQQPGGQGFGGSPNVLDSAQFALLKFNALDLAYYDFWKTFRNTRNVSILGSFGTNPLYNIKGGAIGVFIGVSPTVGWLQTPIN